MIDGVTFSIIDKIGGLGGAGAGRGAAGSLSSGAYSLDPMAGGGGGMGAEQGYEVANSDGVRLMIMDPSPMAGDFSTAVGGGGAEDEDAMNDDVEYREMIVGSGDEDEDDSTVGGSEGEEGIQGNESTEASGAVGAGALRRRIARRGAVRRPKRED